MGRGTAPEGKKAAVTLVLSDADFGKLVEGKVNAQKLFMSGKLKVRGDVMRVRSVSCIYRIRELIFGRRRNWSRCLRRPGRRRNCRWVVKVVNRCIALQLPSPLEGLSSIRIKRGDRAYVTDATVHT